MGLQGKLAAALIFVLGSSLLWAQATTPRTLVRAGHLLDVKTGKLLDAQTNYYSAVRAYAQARYDYLTNVLTLKQQAGRLTELDLVAIDDLLIVSGP